MSSDRWRFERVGLGYRVTADKMQTEIKVTRLKRSSGELHGEVRFTTNLENVKTNNGVLHISRMNLSSSATRERMAKMLEKRTPKHNMDWFDGIETLCQDVMNAESTGQPYLEVGQDETQDMETTYLVEPLIPANVPSIVYAEGGSGKSVIALANALSVETGWQYIPGFLPTETGRVLYLDYETDAAVMNKRVQRIAAGAGQQPPKILYRRCIRPLYEEAEEVANHVAERGVKFLIVDSAGMAMGGAGERGDANENTLRLFDAIRHINVTTQIIDHVSKQETRIKGKRGRLPYGSIYKINLSRSAWEVRTDVGDQEHRIKAQFIHIKANDSHLHDDIAVEIDWAPDGGPIKFIESEADVFDRLVRDSDYPDAVADILVDGPLPRTKVIKRLREMGLDNRSSAYKAMNRMVTDGRLLNGGNDVRLPEHDDDIPPPESGHGSGHDPEPWWVR